MRSDKGGPLAGRAAPRHPGGNREGARGAADQLAALAHRVRWLAPPDHRAPHKFFEDRDDLARDLDRLGRALAR